MYLINSFFIKKLCSLQQCSSQACKFNDKYTNETIKNEPLLMFSIPNILTALNMLSGVAAILFTFAGRLYLAPYALFCGALFDFFDGFVARRMKITGEMGKQLDSLADMITFGLAPGIMMLNILVASIYVDGPHYALNFQQFAHFQLTNWMNAVFLNVPNSMDASIKFLPFFALIIPFFSMFRLAKFNIDERQTDAFIGLPTPLNTFFFCFFPLLFDASFSSFSDSSKLIQWIFDPYILVLFCFLMSFLLISELPLFSLKFKHFYWIDNQIRYVFLIVNTLFIVFFSLWAIPLIVLLYVVLSLFFQINKSKTHEI
jgi:CDP-diacylglycerol--serine O-phosphatidyltransferase